MMRRDRAAGADLVVIASRVLGVDTGAVLESVDVEAAEFALAATGPLESVDVG